MRRALTVLALALLAGPAISSPAGATPVCTDGFMGGPPAAACGGRIFPEAAGAAGYIQFGAEPGTGFREYLHGVQYLAKKYPRWVSVFTLADHYRDQRAVSAGADHLRPDGPDDTKDGRELVVIKVTDHEVPDAGKETLFFSLSIHGNERGGLEGGVRTAEDLAIAASSEGTIVDGVDNYATVTGRKPEFHTYPVSAVLRNEVVYFLDMNPDGWAVGDTFAVPSQPYQRGNSLGTDLNRQMPTVGWIDSRRNPLEESEARYSHRFMHDVAAAGQQGRLAFGGDIHGELNSAAYVDIMYPAGQFTSVEHRRLMAVAERTKSVIDATLFEGIANEIEEASGGNDGEGVPGGAIPTKPAHWATVWDTLGYTDTGFVGDYIATDLAHTGMDYEIFLNHTVPDRGWTVALQENHINATRAIVKTAMAYALTQRDDFNAKTVRIATAGRAGYLVNPDTVTDADGVGSLPGPQGDGEGANGKPVAQRPYRATPMRWFEDTSPLLEHPFKPVASGDVSPAVLDSLDTLVLADVAFPKDANGRPVDRAAYFAALTSWVRRGGNLVLTDRAIHALAEMKLVAADDVEDFGVYQPYVDITDLSHPLVARLRANARQLVEATLLGYEIGDEASPMTGLHPAAFAAAGGRVVGTSMPGGSSGFLAEDGLVTLGEVKVGEGRVVVLGGALPTPSEANDHRYGLRDYAMTYTATFILENALRWDAPGLGVDVPDPGLARGGTLPRTGGGPLPATLDAVLLLVAVEALRRRSARAVPDGRRWARRPRR